ncbi:MAG: hypothetical protein ACT4OP_03080 [Actinomycetota bacterium]
MTWAHRMAVFFLAISIAACGGPGEDPPTGGSVPGGTVPPDAGSVFIDSTEILLMESFPVQVALHVIGSLPTPCHQAVWEVEDDGSTISVTLGSVAEAGAICAQVLEPVDLSIPLGSFETGARVVTLNGEQVGEFEI